MKNGGYVYIMTNAGHTVLYTGVTSNIELRVTQHKVGGTEGFSSKYHTTKLVFFEFLDSMHDAIALEKNIKGKTRAKKIAMIIQQNPRWSDLAGTCVDNI
ncbi:MAG: GIY-YIG nuclease family protein [Proteobacteria bacterium]|nr:GIY-YIG nuclease family protein [Pseudomonadota bacterium]